MRTKSKKEDATAEVEQGRSSSGFARRYTREIWIIIGVLLAAFLVHSMIATEFNLRLLSERLPRMGHILRQLLHPEWAIFPGLLWDMYITIQIAFLGTLIATILSFPLSFIAASNLMFKTKQGKILFYTARMVMSILRAFPPIILALMFVVVVGIGPFAGVLSLGLHSIGMLGKLFAESIEAADKGPVEAIEAVGASGTQVVWYGILPQVVPQFIALSLYRLDINIRMSIILGIVGAGGIGFKLLQYINLTQYSKASTAFVLLLIAVALLDWLSTYTRQKFA